MKGEVVDPKPYRRGESNVSKSKRQGKKQSEKPAVMTPKMFENYFASVGIWDGYMYCYADAQTARDARALLEVVCESCRDEEGDACISIFFSRTNENDYHYWGELHFTDSYDANRFVELLHLRDEGYPPLNEEIEGVRLLGEARRRWGVGAGW
jgi:hypothetical protein